MWGFVIALISGALMSVQGVFNTAVTKQTSIWVAAACLIMWLITGRQEIGALFQVEPKYMLAGGILGAFITYTVIRSVASLGPAKSALLIVVSQIVVAYAIEVMGLFGVEKTGFEWRKAIGALIAIAGIIIFRY